MRNGGNGVSIQVWRRGVASGDGGCTLNRGFSVEGLGLDK